MGLVTTRTKGESILTIYTMWDIISFVLMQLFHLGVERFQVLLTLSNVASVPLSIVRVSTLKYLPLLASLLSRKEYSPRGRIP